ncbi:hypothetical protein Cgig2_025757 [Carnegiea gigantea]|uniref:Uncharacterized protein n=1 Tax=Carnegiea gigantea TaxID=171969 RepID=A0A9Q1Q5T5_9CARY|nr:hypothetical protein Cgig2_025757 [Carnegiea gigantea]
MKIEDSSSLCAPYLVEDSWFAFAAIVLNGCLRRNLVDAVNDVQQVNDEQLNETTVEAINHHLDILRPAIKNYGGEMNVITIVGGDCTVRHEGLQTIGLRIYTARKGLMRGIFASGQPRAHQSLPQCPPPDSPQPGWSSIWHLVATQVRLVGVANALEATLHLHLEDMVEGDIKEMWSTPIFFSDSGLGNYPHLLSMELALRLE